MKKEEARPILEKIILSCVYKNPLTGDVEISLPVYDLNINTINMPEPIIATTLQEQLELEDRPLEFTSYSFRGLIKLIYDLEDKAK